MNSPRDMMRQAMELDLPPRTPLMCQLSIGHMLLQLEVSPLEFWHDPDVFAAGLCRLRELYQFDGVLVSLHGHDPDWKSGIVERKLTPVGEEVTWKNGQTILYLPDDLPRPLAGAPQAMHPQAQRGEDLPKTLDYIPVSQSLRFDLHSAHMFDVFRKVQARIGEEYSLHGEITSPFDYFLDCLGHQKALMYLLTEPDRSTRILQHYTTLVKDLAVRMCRAGVDAIKVSSPFAGMAFISPEVYKYFVLPFEREIAQAVRATGAHIYTHTCGAISDRLELLIDAGVSGIECLDPPPLGNVELADAKRRIGSRGFIKGNIDSVNTLLNGSRESILEDAKSRLRIGREGGGFILSTACSVAPYVSRENLLFLREAVDRWG